MAHGLELEIWEQNYCLSTSGKTAHALLMTNEMPSSKAISQSSSFSRSAGQSNRGSGDEIKFLYSCGTATFVVGLVAEGKENAANYCKAYRCVD